MLTYMHRDWGSGAKKGPNVTILDLKEVYIQVHIHTSLWSLSNHDFQVWFRLNIAPAIMKTIVDVVLSEHLCQATSVNLDIYTLTSVISADCVKHHLTNFGLTCKDPERLWNGTCFDLQVKEESNFLNWRCRNDIAGVSEVMTQHFSWRRKWVGQFPVCGWFHVATLFAELYKLHQVETKKWRMFPLRTWLEILASGA